MAYRNMELSDLDNSFGEGSCSSGIRKNLHEEFLHPEEKEKRRIRRLPRADGLIFIDRGIPDRLVDSPEVFVNGIWHLLDLPDGDAQDPARKKLISSIIEDLKRDGGRHELEYVEGANDAMAHSEENEDRRSHTEGMADRELALARYERKMAARETPARCVARMKKEADDEETPEQYLERMKKEVDDKERKAISDDLNRVDAAMPTREELMKVITFIGRCIKLYKRSF